MHDNEKLPPPSKSQRKREAHALQALGGQLVGLSAAQLEKMSASLPPDLLEAVRFARGLHQRGARKRQLQYIGKLMRSIDTEPIEQALHALTAADAGTKRRERYIERLCEAALSGEQQPIEAFFDDHAEADRQHIRQLIRNAIREQRQNKPPKSRRLLFRYLRELLQAQDDESASV